MNALLTAARLMLDPCRLGGRLGFLLGSDEAVLASLLPAAGRRVAPTAADRRRATLNNETRVMLARAGR